MRKEISDLVQTIILALTFLATLYTVRRQSKEITRTQELSTAATLFEYYNAKISSLRNSIMRDEEDKKKARIMARLDELGDREADLDEFLEKHEKVRERLERLYGELAE
jgi:prephenate dehydrogenase